MDGKQIWQQGRHWLACLMVVALAACGGSGGGSTYVPPTGTPAPTATPVPTATPSPAPYVSSATVTTLAGSAPGTDGTGTAARFGNLGGSVAVGGNVYVADVSTNTIRKIVSATGVVSTFAGTAYARGSSDGIGAAARFSTPRGITSDGTNLYVTDTWNCTIRKIVIATGAVSTLAGSVGVGGSNDGTGTAAKFVWPEGITSDGYGNLYVTDNFDNTIRKIVIASGVVTTLAGTANSTGAADGTGSAARFYQPRGITSDGTNLYVADSENNTIRKIVIANGVVTTLAGTAGSSGSANGTGAAARFFTPSGIIHDSGNLYVADEWGMNIRKIVIASGAVTTLAGNGARASLDGAGTAASFYSPTSISSDGSNLYVSDSNAILRKIVINTGVVSTLVGSISADGTDAQAGFRGPSNSVAVGGNLYVTDTQNHTIRKVVLATSATTTFAGTVGEYGNTDGTGTTASFSNPLGITSDGTNLYVADTNNHTIRKIVIATGAVTTFAGSAGYIGSADGTGAAARFDSPHGITCDGSNLYVVDENNHAIRKIVIATGAVTTLAGSNSGSRDGTGTGANFDHPKGISNDGTNLYVSDTGNHTIRKIVIATGVVITLAGSATNDGFIDGTGTAARFSSPQGIFREGANLYVVDTDNHTIRKIVIATGAVTTLAGFARSTGSSDGTGMAARFYYPGGISSDGSALYVMDTDNNTIRKITGF